MLNKTTDKHILNASFYFLHKKYVRIIEIMCKFSDLRGSSEDTDTD
jgi:hypothetical protein